jgi:alanine racemase
VIVAGKRCPLVGHVSMDLIAVDVTDRRARGAATSPR